MEGVVAYLLGLGPLVLGQQLVLVTALDGATETVDTVVGLLGRQTLKSNLHSLGLLLVKIVVSKKSLVSLPSLISNLSAPFGKSVYRVFRAIDFVISA